MVNRSIIEWDYNSNEELPIEECMAHRLAHQLSYLNRTRNCLRHDGRLEAASGAVRRFRDSLNISAVLEIAVIAAGLPVIAEVALAQFADADFS